MADGKFHRVSGGWQDVILVCRKCSKKIDGGFGPDRRTRLDKYLRSRLALGKGRKARVGLVTVPCFDVCPKRAVTVMRGSTPDVFHVIPEGADAEEIATVLGLDEPQATVLNMSFLLKNSSLS